MKETIEFKLNDKPVHLDVDGERMLIWVLRGDLGLTGTKHGCGVSYCGACTVLVNREPVRSCQVPVKDMIGKEVITIEGLAKNGNLHPLQKAFMEQNALQCGFCTPGMILSAKALLERNPDPTDDDIKTALAGNLCRCTGYTKILDAVRSAAGDGDA